MPIEATCRTKERGKSQAKNAGRRRRVLSIERSVSGATGQIFFAPSRQFLAIFTVKG